MNFERRLKSNLPPFSDEEWAEEVRKMEGVSASDVAAGVTDTMNNAASSLFGAAGLDSA